MPIISHDKELWTRLRRETQFRSPCVKVIGGNIGNMQSVMCGQLCDPLLSRGPGGDVNGNPDLYDAIRRSEVQEVIVVGHGNTHTPAEIFVWRGARSEFIETWECD